MIMGLVSVAARDAIGRFQVVESLLFKLLQIISMPTQFERHLKQYSQYSDVIRDIVEADFSSFDPGKGDEVLVWDQENHVGMMNRHNYALLFWIDYFLSSGTKPVLVHVDAHRDMDEPSPPDSRNMKNPEYAAKYIDSLQVKEFIVPAEELEIFESIDLIGHGFNNSFRNFNKVIEVAKNETVVFDLDLDIFDDPLIEKEYNSDQHRKIGLNYQDAYRKFALLIKYSELTTIAFSPDYMDAGLAEKHLREIRKAYEQVSDSGGFLSGLF